MFCTCARSCARVDDAKIVRSRNAQCKTRESPLVVLGSVVDCVNVNPSARVMRRKCAH